MEPRSINVEKSGENHKSLWKTIINNSISWFLFCSYFSNKKL